jgi:methylase of polypeptide subunit release factors
VDIVNTDLVRCLEAGLYHKVDILLFNPPYVPTPADEGERMFLSKDNCIC